MIRLHAGERAWMIVGLCQKVLILPDALIEQLTITRQFTRATHCSLSRTKVISMTFQSGRH